MSNLNLDDGSTNLSAAQDEAPVAPASKPAPAKSYTREQLYDAISASAKAYDVDPDVMAAMITRESGWSDDVISGKRKSSAGAVGIAQFMPETAKRYGIDPKDPEQAIFGMGAYMRDMLDKFGGDYRKAVAGYNWGENRKAYDAPDWDQRTPKETTEYLAFVEDFVGQAKGGGRQSPQPSPIQSGRGDAGMNAQQASIKGDAMAAQAKAFDGEATIGKDLRSGWEDVQSMAAGGTALPSVLAMRGRANIVRGFDAMDRGENNTFGQPLLQHYRQARDKGDTATMAAMRAQYAQTQGEANQGSIANIAAQQKKIEGYQAESQRLSGDMPKFLDIDSAGAAGTYAKRTISRGVPMLATAMAGAALGPGALAATAGTTALADLNSQAMKAGADVLPPVRHGTADRIADAIASNPEDRAARLEGSVGATLAMAVPYTLADTTLGPAAQVAKRVFGSAAKNASQQTTRQALKAAPVTIAKGAAGEAFTEGVVQEGVAGVGREYLAGERTGGLNGDDLERVIEAGAAGAAIGAPASAVPAAIDVQRARAAKSFTPPNSAAAAAGLSPIVVPAPATPAERDGDNTAPAHERLQSYLAKLGPKSGGPPTGDAGAGLGDDGSLADAAGGRVAMAGAAGDPGANVAERGQAIPEPVANDALSPPGVEDGVKNATEAANLDADVKTPAPEEASIERVDSWRGRGGQGFVTEADAQQAVPGRMERFKGAEYRIERDGDKFVVNGYAKQRSDADINAEIDRAVSMAATSDQNDLAEPTEGQKRAGNYAKGHYNYGGMSLSFANAKGSVRSGVNPDGKAWSNTMQHHYGYIKRTKGADKDHLDFFMGGNPASKQVFVVDQAKADGTFDEHKVVFGAKSAAQAKDTYLANYARGWNGGRGIMEMSIEQFRSWAASGPKTRPLTSMQETFSAGIQPGAPTSAGLPSDVQRRPAGITPTSAASAPSAGVTPAKFDPDIEVAIGSIQGARRDRYQQDVRLTPVTPPAGGGADAAHVVAKALGVKLAFVNARYLTKPDRTFSGAAVGKTIVLDAGSKRAPLRVAMHELLHSLDDDVKGAAVKAIAPYMRRDAHQQDFPAYGDKIRDEEIAASLAEEHAATPEFWLDLASKMEDGAFKQFMRQVRLTLDKVIDALTEGGLTKYATEVSAVRDALTTAYATQIKRNRSAVRDSDAEFSDDLGRSSRWVRNDPAEARAALGLKAQGRVTNFELASAMDARAQKLGLVIKDSDTSADAADKVSDALADEVRYQFETASRKNKTGVGWYTKDYQKALRELGTVYPELQRSKNARNAFTLLAAITSNGEELSRNLAMARGLYEAWRVGGDVAAAVPGSSRDKALRKLIDTAVHLRKKYGDSGMHKVMMEHVSVKQIKTELGKAGAEATTGYTKDMVLPRAAVYIGPKLGVYYANLMGSSEFLTADRWFSRTFNRARGAMVEGVTKSGTARMRELLGAPDATVDELVELSKPYQKAYEAKGYEGGSALEVAANSYVKNYYGLNDAPMRATDRRFMVQTMQMVLDKLAKSGHNLSMADAQAALWYYEKRLFGELGVAGKGISTISYLEAIENALEQERGSPGGPQRPAARSDGEGVADAGGLRQGDAAQDEGAEFSDDAGPAAGGLRDGRGVRGGPGALALDGGAKPGNPGGRDDQRNTQSAEVTRAQQRLDSLRKLRACLG